MTRAEIAALRPGQILHLRLAGRCRVVMVHKPVNPGDNSVVWASNSTVTARLSHHTDVHRPEECPA